LLLIVLNYLHYTCSASIRAGGSRNKFSGPGGPEGGPRNDYFAYSFVFLVVSNIIR